jgi:Fe-S-cluster containining protein
MEAVIEIRPLAFRTFRHSGEAGIERSTYHWHDFLLNLWWEWNEAGEEGEVELYITLVVF